MAPPSDHQRAAATRRADRARLPLGLALLVGPAVLAFFSGGYEDGPRDWAGAIAWALVAAAVALDRRALPRGRPALLAAGGLALFAGWTLLSVLWTPVAGRGYHYAQIAFVYLGAVLAGSALLRGRVLAAAVEPVLLAGTVAAIGYGLSARLLPGLIHLTPSPIAEGRLNDPLTYWNGMGELAAIGLILALRLAGDVRRPNALRALGAAACAPLGLGLYLSFSRGALFAAVAGLVALVVLAPSRAQLRAIAIGIPAAVVVSAVAAPMHGMTALTGQIGTRETQGAIALAVTGLLTALAAGAALWSSRLPDGVVRLPARAPWVALVLVVAGLSGAIVLGAKETTALPSAGAARLTTLQSDRYDYWGVALRAFAEHPLNGTGAGGWAVEWLKRRTSTSYAVDAHSLPLQTLAELGVVGALLLLAFLAGVWSAARAALLRARAAAAGPAAALVVYLAHAPLDWDWELPALTLFAAVLVGYVLALAGEAARPAREGAPRFVEADPGAPHAVRGATILPVP